MKVETLYQEFSKLSPRERDCFMQMVYRTLREENPLSSEQINEIESRANDLSTGKLKPIRGAEFIATLQRKYARIH